MFLIRKPLKIHRTKNQRNLFRHTSQKTFAEDELCARIFVVSDEKSSRCASRAEYLEVTLTKFRIFHEKRRRAALAVSLAAALILWGLPTVTAHGEPPPHGLVLGHEWRGLYPCRP